MYEIGNLSIVKTRMASIIDVAKRAGVSPSTVSHALNGKRSIGKATKQRIFAAIEELGYEPNINAQALRGARSPIIGFLASNITEQFAARIIQGTERVTRERNAYLLFASGAEFDNDLREAVKFLRRRQIDGLIVSYGISGEKDLELLRHLQIPMVTVNARIDESIPSVMPDNLDGGQQAARHLIERGSRFPTMIAGPRNRMASRERVEGFLSMIREREPDTRVEAQRIFHGDFSPASGAEGFKELLRLNPEIDGIFCANDFMAAGAMNAAAKAGMGVPEKLRVAGFDNRDFTAFWPIPISTFALPLDDMGHVSAELIFDLIDGKTPETKKIKLKSMLVQRQST